MQAYSLCQFDYIVEGCTTSTLDPLKVSYIKDITLFLRGLQFEEL